VAGPVIINTGLSAANSIQTGDTGAGTFRRAVEVDMSNATQVDTLNGLLTHAQDYYINMHTTEFPGGLIRDQLRNTDQLDFQVTMLPSNETPPITGLDATAPAVVSIHTIRAEDGTVLAGSAIFDVNYRFPAAHVEFTGLHVHDGAATVAGPVRLNSGLSGANSVISETGFGNVYRFATMSDTAAVATLNSLVQNPENHYVNIHTTVNPGGAIRAQLAAANTALPVVTSGGNAADGSASAPGGLIKISGTNLAKVTDGLGGWRGKTLPTSFDGSKLTIGGKNAAILFVSPTVITAQVPVDAPAGSQPVVVTNSNGAGTASNVTIAAVAPAVFSQPNNSGAAS
jgi:CHRD domain./IPT/TIG domain.